MNIGDRHEPGLGSTADVFVVDTDMSARESLKNLIQSAGWRAETFSDAQQLLSRVKIRVPSCLIIDDSLPDLSGLDVQARINAERIDLPIIFITNFPDVRTTVRAMKSGAVEFFTKPLSDNLILSAIRHAVDRSHLAMARHAQLLELQERYAILTAREREVMDLVVEGLLNKQIGWELDIAEITVKVHRGKLMRKMKATTLVDLVKKVWMLRAASGFSDDSVNWTAFIPSRQRPRELMAIEA